MLNDELGTLCLESLGLLDDCCHGQITISSAFFATLTPITSIRLLLHQQSLGPRLMLRLKQFGKDASLALLHLYLTRRVLTHYLLHRQLFSVVERLLLFRTTLERKGLLLVLLQALVCIL